MPRDEASGSRWADWAVNLLLVVSSTVIFLASLEGIARLAGQRPCVGPAQQTEGTETKVRPHPLRQYELIPGVTFTFKREAALRHGLSPEVLDTWERIPYRINSLGLRGPETDAAKPADAFRILVLGDSVAFGWGAEEESTFTCQLQQLLNQAGSNKQFRVWNAGVPGYATWQELAYLIEKGQAFQPDMILVAFLFNDVDGNNEAAQGQPLGLGTVGRTFTLATQKSAFLCFLRNKALEFRLEHLQPCRGPNCWTDTETALDGFAAHASKLGSSLVLVAFPMRLQIEPDAKPGYYDRALGENPQESYQDIISRLCRERGIPYLDLLPAFRQAAEDEPGTLFLDPDHPNARGHGVAADAAYDFLLELLPTAAILQYNTNKTITYAHIGVSE